MKSTIYSDIYLDPLPGKQFMFEERQEVHIPLQPELGTGRVVYRGRRMSYRHEYLVKFPNGGQYWFQESRVSA